MNSSDLLSVVTFIYCLASVIYITSWIFRKERLLNYGIWFVAAAAAGNFTGIMVRWIESHKMGYGHVPLSNLYESLIFFALTIAVLYIIIELKYKNALIGAFATPLCFLSMAYASLSPNVSDQIRPLIPALKSNWLTAHVITCFLGYSGFAVGFSLSIMYLIKDRGGHRQNFFLSRLPEKNVLDELTYQMITFGFLFLSIGIITGAVWANSAWGSYWSWDPKETWSLITWFVYSVLIHARLMRGWYGRRIAWISIAGFMAVLFTYFGVNYLPGLHSYAQ